MVPSLVSFIEEFQKTPQNEFHQSRPRECLDHSNCMQPSCSKYLLHTSFHDLYVHSDCGQAPDRAVRVDLQNARRQFVVENADNGVSTPVPSCWETRMSLIPMQHSNERQLLHREPRWS